MKPKIAIVLDISFTERDYKRFGISTLKKKFNVFIFDFTKSFSTKLANHKFSKKTHKCEGYYSVKNISIFKSFITKNKFSNCIFYISNKSLEGRLLDILKKNKIPVIKIQNGLAIGPEYPRSIMQNLHILSLKFTDKKKFLTFIANRFSRLTNKFIKKK